MEQQRAEEAAAAPGAPGGEDEEGSGYSSSEAGSYASRASSFASAHSTRGSPTSAHASALEDGPEASGASPTALNGSSSWGRRSGGMQRSATSRGGVGLTLRPSSPGREISTHLRVGGLGTPPGWMHLRLRGGLCVSGEAHLQIRWQHPTQQLTPRPPPSLHQAKKVQELVAALIRQFRQAYGPLVLVLGEWRRSGATGLRGSGRGPVRRALACAWPFGLAAPSLLCPAAAPALALLFCRGPAPL